MSATKILYVLNAAGGGASIGIYELLRKMPQDRYDAYAIMPPGNSQQIQQIRPLFSDVIVTPLRTWNVPDTVDLFRRTARTFGLRRNGVTLEANTDRIARAIHEWGIDIVHTGTAITLSGALAAQKLGIPHIWHIKETIGSKNWVQFPMSDAKLIAYMQSLSTQIVVMSDYIGQVFVENNCTNLHVIPDGIDFDQYQTGSSRKLRETLGVADDQPLIGMVASMTSTWKRHEVFIRMAGLLAEKHPTAQFIIAGPKPSPKARWPYDLNRRYYESLERLASEVVPEGRIKFLGVLPNPTDIMRSLDVLVHPCDIEPFGRIAIEAMAAGTPVVGPNVGGISETVVDGETGILVAPGAPEAFANATEQLIRDPSLRAKMGSAGQKHVREHYTIERMWKRLSPLYDSVRVGVT